MSTKTDFMGRDTYTWWVGEVEDNEDPSELGRVKVRILGWYTGVQGEKAFLKEVPTEILPWATVLLPCDKPQTKSAGTTTELQPGAWVLGFFLDGEEAQLPCVLGSFRGFQQQQSDADTTIADPTIAEKKKTNTPGQKSLTGEQQKDGHPYPKVQTTTPSNTDGNVEEARGVISTAEQTVPGNVVTNPIKPPVNANGIADGVAGPAGKGFETALTRMLTELGEMAASMGSGPGGFVSVITGNKMAGDKVREHLGKVMNFLSSGISGILAPLKEMLAKLIAEVVGMVVKIISQFVPIVVINTIMSFLTQIFDIFCAKTPMWLGLVKGALSDTANFANQMASLAVDKIASSTIGKAIDSAVKGLSNRILSGITNAMNRVRDVTGDVMSAVSAAKGLAGAARALGDTVNMIMEFDFTSLDWGSLLQILLAILGMLFKKNCGRKIKRPKSKAWYPLLGTTECDNLEDAVKGTPYKNVDGLFDQVISGANSLTAAITGATSYIDQMFQQIDPQLMQTETSLNGSKIINDATPGKEKRIVSGPGGVSSFEDSWGNRHTNVPNNETKIIAKDKCETIKGNYTLTVEGDFYLKVMGNFHEEVTGAKNENHSQGPQSDSEGSSDNPDTSTTGGNVNDVDTNVTTGVVDSDTTAQANDLGSGGNFLLYKRNKALQEKCSDGFYPVDQIPYPPDADEWGRTPNGPQLSGDLKDDTEQKSAARKEGDHDIAYTGEVKIQGAKVSMTGIESLMVNSQNVKIEGNTIENIADGEIVNQANWITSFLNAGRFEFIALFNPFAAITGQFSLVKGAIIDITCDLPFPAVAPPTQIRMSIGQTLPATMADILAGSTNGFHATFVAAPTGVISEFVPMGTLINQVGTGMASYSVGAGYFAAGCAGGPTQIYGLPVMLN